MVEAFRKADKNGDGRLSVDEIYAIYIEHGIEVTREEVEKLVEEADKVTTTAAADFSWCPGKILMIRAAMSLDGCKLRHFYYPS